MSDQETNARHVRQVELFISNLLRVGVIVSLLLICAGMAVSVVRHREEMSEPSQRETFIEAASSSSPHTFTGVIQRLRHFRGQGIIMLGLIVLIATPVMRVAASIVGFVYERDGTFVLITSVVLVLLVISFVLGRAGG